MSLPSGRLLAGSLVLLLVSPHVAPAVTPVLLVTSGLLGVFVVARRLGGDRVLCAILVASYLVKAAVATVLYVVSAHALPLLRAQQLGHGWWTFARDSGVYDLGARRVLDAWHLGLTLPMMTGEKGQVIATAAEYLLLGPRFVHAALVNAWLGTLVALLAVALTRRFAPSVWTVRAIAMIVGFWPSLILWSSQLLKEPLVISLTLGEILVFTGLGTRRPASRARRWGAWFLAGALIFLIQFQRDYVAFTMVAATAVFLAAAALLPDRMRWRPAVALVVVAGVSVFASALLDLSRLVGPLHATHTHFRLALAAERAGDRNTAVAQYVEAVHYDTRYAPAYRNLGILFACEGDADQAELAFAAYLRSSPQDATAEVAAALAEIRGSRAARTRVTCPPLAPARDPGPRSLWLALAVKFAHPGGALEFLSRATPRFIGATRTGMVKEGEKSGWRSLIDTDVRVNTVARIAGYSPRGLVVILFAPFPWEWLDLGGDAGFLKLFAGFEALLIYLLIPGFVVLVPTLWGRKEPVLWYSLTFALLLGALLAAAVPNVGALFRLRLDVILLLVVTLASAGVLERVYGLAWLRGPRRCVESRG